MKIRIENFLEDYNALLEEFNDAIGGIDDMTGYRKCTSFEKVDVRNIEDDEDLLNEYNEIINLKK